MLAVSNGAIVKEFFAFVMISLFISSSCYGEGPGRYEGYELVEGTEDEEVVVDDEVVVGAVVIDEASPIVVGQTLPDSQFGQLPNQNDSVSGSIPGYLSSFVEPGLGTVVTRVSSNQIFQSANGFATHRYSKRQAWNTD